MTDGHLRLRVLPMHSKRTYSIIIVCRTWTQTPSSQHLRHLLHRVIRGIRHLLAIRERSPVLEIIPDAMSNPIEAEEVRALVDAIAYPGRHIEVREEELQRFSLAYTLSYAESFIVYRVCQDIARWCEHLIAISVDGQSM